MKIAGVVAACCLAAWPAAAQTVAVRAGHLVDPATGRVADGQVILVRDGRVVEVGRQVEIPPGTRTIDLSRSWVMPGLMDAHVHITFGQRGPLSIESSYLAEGSPMRALHGAMNARSVLEAGFTAVKDIGNDANYAAVALSEAISRGWVPGPRMLATGKIIAPFGGQSHGVPPEQGTFWRFEYIDADTPDEVRKAVRQDIYYGATAIKLVADNSRFTYSREEIAAAADEAHRAGLTLAVHVMGGEAARNVILGGADSIEHGFDLDDDLLGLMKEKGTVLVGTDFPESHLQEMGLNAPAGGKSLGQRIVDRLRRAHQLGVTLAFGSDVVLQRAPGDRGSLMLDYLDVWTAAGIPPAEILKAMTVNVAALFRWQDRAGTLAPGRFADLIAMPTSPLADIHALRQVHFVMKGGEIVRQDPLQGPAPPAAPVR